MNRARNKARPDPKLYIFKKNKCLFQFTLDLIRVSPALSQKHKYQFSAEVSCLPLSEKHLLRTTASSCSRKLLSPFYKNTREQFALLEPSGGTGPELTMSRYPLRIDGFGLFIDSLHSSDASSTLPAWALRFWTAAAHADVCVCVCPPPVLSFYLELYLMIINENDVMREGERERHWSCHEMLPWRLYADHFSRLFLPVTQKTNVRPYLPTQKTPGFLSVSQFSHVSLDFMTIFSSSQPVSDTAQCSVCCTVAPRPPRCTRDRRRPWKEEFLKIKQRSVA